MNLRNRIVLLILLGAVAFLVVSTQISTDKATTFRQNKPETPNYSLVFPDNQVNRIDIKINQKEWQKMQSDLASNLQVSHRMPPMHDRNVISPEKPSIESKVENKNERGHQHPPRMGRPAHRMGNDSISFREGNRRMPHENKQAAYKPITVPCTILFNNEKWKNVGIRYKGNSSLRSAYQQGVKKLSFKLDFDEFEDEYPEIKNQRFYGFKQLNLKNNYDDPSLIREKVASDLFSEFGLLSPKTSFYQVYVDYGEGSKYFGLYTMVEEVDDTLIKNAFSGSKGNLYKPESFGASFAKDSFRSSDMNKKSNKKAKDYSDVQQLYTVLNSSLRTENVERWKTQLSEIFDVPVFLKWLAANTVMQNWDSYGNMPHNYFLYNNPTNHKLVWIPWDNNEAFQQGKMGGALPLSLDNINEEWPLIKYIIDDNAWKNQYKKNLAEFSTNIFNTDKMILSYTTYEELLKDFVIGDYAEKPRYTFLRDEQDFTNAFEILKQQVQERNFAVHDFLDTNNM